MRPYPGFDLNCRKQALARIDQQSTCDIETLQQLPASQPVRGS